MEILALRLAVAIGSLIPISAGGAGILLGPRMLGSITVSGDFDSHFRYLSGLLLAIGFGFASTIPRIETQGARFRLLTGIVVVGGAGRLMSTLAIGAPSLPMILALGMELLVTPGLAIWQWRVARSARRAGRSTTRCNISPAAIPPIKSSGMAAHPDNPAISMPRASTIIAGT